MSRRLRRTAAVLLVACAGLFVVGVVAEGDTHAEPTEATGFEAAHEESEEEARLLGVNVESPAAVVLAVAVSLALAVGLWMTNRRWLAVAAIVVAVVFAVFDIAETAHLLEESRTGIAVLAAVIAAGHLAAAAAAGLSTRRAS